RAPAEIIVVDDASDDDTPRVIAALPDSIRKITFPENRGAGSARNAGWQAATQEFIAFLDADDAWHPQKLELQTAWMQAHPEVVLSGHGYVFSAVAEKISIEKAIPVSAAMLLVSNRFSTPCAMLRREIPQRFAEGKRASEDYHLWLEIVLGGGAAWHL